MTFWQLKKRDADLERELRSDLELEEEEQRENDLPTEKARYAARRAFANTTLINRIRTVRARRPLCAATTPEPVGDR
jgi:hypothetical protein